MTPADYFDAHAAESEGLLPALGRDAFIQACAILALDTQQAALLIERCVWPYLRARDSPHQIIKAAMAQLKREMGRARSALGTSTARHGQARGLLRRHLPLAADDPLLLGIEAWREAKERAYADAMQKLAAMLQPPPPAPRPLAQAFLKAAGVDLRTAANLICIIEGPLAPYRWAQEKGGPSAERG